MLLSKRKAMQLYSSFEIVVTNDTMIVLTDIGIGKSVTNDADNVIDCLQKIIPGGIGSRAVYYRDSCLRYDRLRVEDGVFAGFQHCTSHQQGYFSKLANSACSLWTVYGDQGAVKVVSASS
jgi:hypothetical protein